MRKTRFVKTVNFHNIYTLEMPISGLDYYVIVKDNVVKKSFPTLEEAEAFSHVDSEVLLSAMANYMEEEELEQHPPTFWQKIWGAIKDLRK